MTAPADAAAVLRDVFGMLARGVADRRSAFHAPAVATVDHGGAPHVRTVVLRGFDPDARTLWFHSDARSAKVAHLRARPSVAVHVYDYGHRVQLRAAGRAALHHGDQRARAAWAAATDGARDTYRIGDAPGSAVADPGAVRFRALDDDAAFGFFTVVSVALDSVEWLSLAASGHRRVRFDWPDGAIRAEWLAP